jgi:hypothetical protein
MKPSRPGFTIPSYGAPDHPLLVPVTGIGEQIGSADGHCGAFVDAD